MVVWLECRTSATGVTLSNLRITAISAKSLTMVALPV